MDNIELIRDLAVNAARVHQYQPDALPAAVALPEHMKLHSLEKFAALRGRFRGTLATHSLEDFASYVTAHAAQCPNAAGFVDVDKMAAQVVFNLGNVEKAGHCDWVAQLALKPTAPFRALKEIDGKRLDQTGLTDWLEDWNDVLVADFEIGASTLTRAIGAIRKMKISTKAESTHVTSDFAASRSALEDVEASSFDALPIGFRLATEPYDGLSSASFRLKLSVLTSGDKPGLVLRWQRKELQLEAIAREFKSVLASKLGSEFPLTLGTFTP